MNKQIQTYCYPAANSVVVCGDIHGAFEEMVFKLCVQYGMTDTLLIVAGDWGSAIAPVKDELPLKGDTVVGNDVWISQNVTVMPGVHIGDGAIISANSVVAKDIPPYTVAAGNPCRVVKKRFDDEFIAYLLDLKWWDWDIEKIESNFEALSSGDLSQIGKIHK